MVTTRKRNAKKSSPLFPDTEQVSLDSPPSKKSPKPSRRSAVGGKFLHSDAPLISAKPMSSVADLKEMVSSHIRDIKSNIVDRSHAEIAKDLEASRSRLQKRLKIQSQAAQQLMNESEEEYKKIFGRITESSDAMKESYEEFMADVQSTTARVTKCTIPDLSKSLEKMISGLQARYGTHSA